MNKIIHQIWIADSEDMMPCNLRILSNTWKKYNPDWDYHLWCSAEVESLLFSDSLISICCINLYLPNGNV